MLRAVECQEQRGSEGKTEGEGRHAEGEGTVAQVSGTRAHLLATPEARPLVAAALVVALVPAATADYSRVRLHCNTH